MQTGQKVCLPLPSLSLLLLLPPSEGKKFIIIIQVSIRKLYCKDPEHMQRIKKRAAIQSMCRHENIVNFTRMYNKGDELWVHLSFFPLLLSSPSRSRPSSPRSPSHSPPLLLSSPTHSTVQYVEEHLEGGTDLVSMLEKCDNTAKNLEEPLIAFIIHSVCFSPSLLSPLLPSPPLLSLSLSLPLLVSLLDLLFLIFRYSQRW